MRPETSSPSPKPQHHVVEVMETLFRVDPSLTGKELSTRLGLSVSRLARVFKRDAGVSIVEYRNRIRFRKFFELLGDRNATRTTLRQAARSAGFGSYAHFHRLFRARWNVCPREYFQNEAAVGAFRRAMPE